jgi:imidazolonepropionase-like amidohydrolase
VGSLIAVPGHPPLAKQSIVIRGSTIERIVDGLLKPEAVGGPSDQVVTVDASSLVVLPGLFDLHVHLTTEPGPSGALDEVTKNSADLTLMAAANAQKTVEAGFTTVLDMGTGRRTHELAIFAVRDAVRAGQLTGPRILAVGSPICAPGQCRSQRFQSDVERAVEPQGMCTGADDCRRAVREQIRRGADVISFFNTGSLLAPGAPAQTFTDEEMRAIVGAAHALNRKAVADGAGTTSSASGINAAIAAGADWVDTAIYPDKGTWAAITRARIYYAPHLYAVVAAVGDTPETLETGSMGWLPRPVLDSLWRLKRERPAAAEAQRLHIPMVFASDAGVFEHGRNAGEFAEYVHNGMTAEEAIATATINAAALLGLDRDSGSIEPGKRADLIAVAGDPLTDIRRLQHVELVIAAGRVVKQRTSP